MMLLLLTRPCSQDPSRCKNARLFRSFFLPGLSFTFEVSVRDRDLALCTFNPIFADGRLSMCSWVAHWHAQTRYEKSRAHHMHTAGLIFGPREDWEDAPPRHRLSPSNILTCSPQHSLVYRVVAPLPRTASNHIYHAIAAFPLSSLR